MKWTEHRRANLLCAGLALVTTYGIPTRAWAQESSPYCREARARGTSDAVILMSPQLVAQGIRFPGSGVDLTTVGAPNQYQARVGLAFSPLDFYKGIGVMDTADADCAQHEAQVAIEALLLTADDAGKLPALRKQAAYLDGHRAEWQAVGAKEEERFTARVITLAELQDSRSRVAELERKVAQTHGEAERIDARAAPRPSSSLRTLASNFVARANEFENEVSHVRSLQPWQFRVTGGIVPSDQPVDWYGLVELSFNLGAFAHNHQETLYKEARDDELRHARYELDGRLRDFQKQAEATRTQARRELEIVGRQLGTLATTKQALERSEAPNVLHAVAILTLEQMSLESEQVFLRGLVDELSLLLADDRGKSPATP